MEDPLIQQVTALIKRKLTKKQIAEELNLSPQEIHSIFWELRLGEPDAEGRYTTPSATNTIRRLQRLAAAGYTRTMAQRELRIPTKHFNRLLRAEGVHFFGDKIDTSQPIRIKDIIESIEVFASRGFGDKEMAAVLGLTTAKFNKLRAEFKEVNSAFHKAQRRGVAAIISKLYEKALDGHPQMITYFLNNRAPEQWATKTESALSGSVKLPLSLDSSQYREIRQKVLDHDDV